MRKTMAIVIAALLLVAAVPALASASSWDGYKITSARAKQYTVDAAQFRYAGNGVVVNRTTLKAKPQGSQYKWSTDYGTQKFHRWVVRWAGHDGDGAKVYGTFIIAGNTVGYSFLAIEGGLRWA
jgi:hypothetical protein